MRVYFRLSDERWRIGRVRNFFLEDDGSVTYEVRLPNKQDVDVPEAALRVRALAGVWEPGEVLALGASETQRWFDARWPAREALIALRAAGQGLTGLASASVEIVGHQLDAVRRVLHDPLQRYLLADEVGLGKTIEACAVLRQTLIDDVSATAVILTPSALTRQWERELLNRFDLTPGRGGRVQVLPHGDLSADIAAATLLIVDEAHRIEPGSDGFRHLKRLADESPKLLLLSATPPIGHEVAFLALLRLLDPQRWEAETEERFAEHVARSQEYGRLLLGLRPDASAFVLRQRVAGSTSLFPDDTVIADLAHRFQTTEDAAERVTICSKLRQHIADTYRIHQRLIRNRRADLEGWEFQPRGPATLRVEEDADPALQQALLGLEDWRAEALLVSQSEPELADQLAQRYQCLLQILSTAAAPVASLSPIFASEAALLQAIDEAAGDDARIRRAAFVAEVAQRHLRFLRPTSGPARLVVFASDSDFAEAIVAAIRALGVESVFDAATGQDVADDFAMCDAAAIAVFGPAGEEGLNLHFADAILHADLPPSVRRLEQRIGRLDRFGRTRGPIKHVVVAPAADGDTTWSAWCDLLRDGFGIFDRPVGDIQFVLDAIEADVRRLRLLGPQALLDFREQLAGLVAQHRERLDEQYAMDQLAMARESARALAETLEDAEADEDDLAARVDGLLTSTLQLRVRREGKDILTLNWGPNTQLPEHPWRAQFSAGLGRPLTWKRRLSVARPKIALLRPGSALIDALERLLEWDDRGAAFATWRLQPGAGGPGQERLAFRLCWVVGPSTPPANLLRSGEDAEGLRRQAEGFLQPWTLTQHVGPDLQPITDPDWLALLERPYRPEAAVDGSRDFNLGSRPEWLRQVIDQTSFANLCASVTAGAAASLEGSELFRERISAASGRAALEMERRASRRRLRGGFDTDEAAARDAILDDIVRDLIERPRLRLDCIGAFVVAGYVPQAPRR
ncbi:type III restriction enzyme res subunit [Acidisphaera rubrifaciens HS-AP3]|uniref:Type III restriction enzyme res subunit n=2 Tax=Acidisphaera TaxID=50714 RepID=A0A0D6P2G8_9PROT|nr:type III restriction enzyme res subunit [Acidisphaera rubrifaciens HS-AP3]